MKLGDYKKCACCGLINPIEAFACDRGNEDGYSSLCRTCEEDQIKREKMRRARARQRWFKFYDSSYNMCADGKIWVQFEFNGLEFNKGHHC